MPLMRLGFTSMIPPKKLLRAFGKAAYNTVYHDGIEHAGYLAFLNVLALFPFLVFVLALAGFVGEGKAGTEFIQLLSRGLPPNMMKALQPRIAEIISGPPQGLLTLSILGAIWTSSSAVEGYRTVLNRAYHVHTPPAYIWRRLWSIAQILILSFSIVTAMIILVVLPIAWDRIISIFGMSGTLSQAMSSQITFISTLVMFVIVAFAYYVLPNIKQNFHSVAPGAALVTLLWLGAARLLSIYLSQFQQVNLIYGSLGGFIAALLFFYVSNVIFIYGAEFNYLFRVALGEKMEQKQAAHAAARKEINEL
jgi:membrane protein